MGEMERKGISTTAAPEAIGPYSQAVQVGDLIFCSGQIPLDPASGELIGEDDVRMQTERVMENLRAVLAAAGSGFDKAVKATVYLIDLDDFQAVNEVYGRYFDGLIPPARATIEVSALPRGARVEIELIATR